MRRLVILAAILPTLFASGAMLYVKPSATGSGNGADWSNALGPSFTPVRGNIYYVADGSYGAKTWSVPNSGATTITIRKATVADHGTSTGWSDSLGDGEALWGSWVVSTDYWVFDGQWRTPNSSNNWDGAKSGIDYGFRVVGGGASAKTLRLDSGGAGADRCTFKYCDFVGGGSGTGNGDDVVYGLESSDTIAFSYCSLRDSDRTIFLLRGEWQNLLVEYSFMGRNNSTPAIHGELLSDVGSDYVTFRNNVIEDTEGTSAGFAILNGFGNKSSANTANGWKIYGNVFRSTAAGGSISFGVLAVANNPPENENWMDNLYFANNTIVNLNIDWDLMMVISIAGTGNVVVNNVFYDNTASAGTGDTAFVNMGTTSYNWFYNTASTGEAGTGKVICSSSCSTYFQTPASLNMTLVAPLAGIALASEYNTDMLGNIRGADGTWDRGAFEFNSGPDVTPPLVSGLAAASTTSSSATIVFTTSEAAQSGIQYGPTTGYGGSATNASFATSHSFALSGLLPNTVYHYRITATDASGNGTVSGDTMFQTTAIDTIAPSVSLTAPTSGTTVSNTVNLEATAADDIGVAGVVFLVDGAVVGTEDTTAPYSLTWNTATIANGTHSVAARARDAAGNQKTSDAVSVTAQNTGPDLGTGLVGYWDFEEGRGTTATDKIYSSVATLQADATWAGVSAGRFGDGLRLDGTGDYAKVTNATHLELTGNQISVAAWVKLTSTGGYQQLVAKIKEEGAYTDPFFSYHIYGQHVSASQWKPNFQCVNTSGIRPYIGASENVNYGEWVHVVGVFDGALIRIYVNGVDRGNASHSGNLISYDQPLYIGAHGLPGEHANGTIDEVRIYSRALSAAEVQVLHVFVPTTPATKPQLNAPAVQSDGTVLIAWSGGGTLQLAPTANGPWSDVTGAVSPFTWTPPPGTREAYARVRK